MENQIIEQEVTENKKHIKRGLIIIIPIVLGIFLLVIIGKSFVKEIIQEIDIEGEEEFVSVSIGEKAPSWRLSNLAGNVVNSADFLGKPLVLTFWNTWNLMAADQIRIFDDYLSYNDDSIFRVVTINNQEDRSIVVNFIGRGGYQVLVILDVDGSVGELYKVKSLPLTYFLDAKGIVRDIFVGILSEEMLLEKLEKILR